MRTSRRAAFAIMSLAVAVQSLGSPASQQAEDGRPSNTWQTRCILKVTADAEILPLSFDLVETLLRSDAVAGKAAAAACPKGHGIFDKYFDVVPLEENASQEPWEDDVATSEAGDPRPGEMRTVLLALRVHFDSDVGPVAREFGNALIENLRTELDKAFAAHKDDLRGQLTEAESRRDVIRGEFGDRVRQGTFASPQPIRPDPADEALAAQLHRRVDLSAMTQVTPVSQAFEILRHCVEPPLNIIVNWRDLLENANIEPSSPTDIEGPANIELGTALRNLLDAITDPLATGKEYKVDYIIDAGAITVATHIGLPPRKVETRVYHLPPLLRMSGQAPELAALIRETIEPESWQNPYHGSGNGTIAPSPDGRLIVSQSRDVHIKIQDLLAKVTADFVVTLPGAASQETLMERLDSLFSYRGQLEQELDRLQERQGWIARERNERERLVIQSAARDLYAATAELKGIQQELAKTRRDDPQAARLRQVIQTIEQCGRSCMQSASGGGYDLVSIPLPGGEDKTVAQRIADKQSDLREVSRRIAETQRMMAGEKRFDPELNRVEQTARRCEQIDARICDLKTRIENLQPCTIAVLGKTE